MFSSEKCIDFKYGLEFNKSREFINISGLVFGDDIEDIDIYSAAYDLNADGYPEYFYYIDNHNFCGNQTGCYIDVYEYKNTFRKLIPQGWPTFSKFNPEKNIQSKYLCIEDNLVNGWRSLRFKKENIVLTYNGNSYE